MSDQLELPWDDEAPEERAPAPSGDPRAMFQRVETRDNPPAPKTAVRRSEAHYQAEVLRAQLAERIGQPVALRVTNNRSTMMSFQCVLGPLWRVRLHHMFLDAPERVVDALARWMKRPRDKRAGAVLDAYIRARRDRIDDVAQRAPAPRRTRGRHHDLARLFVEVNAAHYQGAIDSAITWGKRPPVRRARRRRSIRFGSYSPRENLIRIHPYLDDENVPEFFVRYIVYHEMLHAHLGIEECPSGRRRIHPPEFKRIEAAYPDYARAIAWMDDPRNMDRLLRGARSEAP